MIISKREHLQQLDRLRPFSPLIAEICNATLADLPAVLEANLKWRLPTGNVLDWVQVLNRFDEVLEEHIVRHGLAQEHVLLHEPPAADARVAVACLQFSRMILDNCINRNLYASADRVYALLDLPAMDVKLAALEMALCLAERYVQLNHHKDHASPKPVRLKVLEMAKAYPPIVPASFVQSRVELADRTNQKHDHYSLVDSLSPAKKYPLQWKALHFEYYHSADPKRTKKDKKQGRQEDGACSFSLSEENIKKLSLQQIYDKATVALPPATWRLFQYAALTAKAFNTKNPDSMALRHKLLRMKCLAVAFVCCACSTDFTSCLLFEVEPYTLSFLMDLVLPENFGVVDTEIFYVALKTIRAISMKRVWGSEIVRHLGGNVNHGLLYQMLRYMYKQATAGDISEHEDGYKVFLTVLCNLVDLKTLAPRLVAGGLLTELMAFMNLRAYNRWLGSSAVHIIAILLSMNPELVHDFADNNGFALLIDTIGFEVTFALENPGYDGGAPNVPGINYTISLRQAKYLRNLFNFVLNLITSDAGDRLRNLFDSPLLGSFNSILSNPNVFGPTILAATLDNVSQIIHNEPTAFSILNEAGLIDTILRQYKQLLMPSDELAMALLEVLGAIALNKNGLEMVINSDCLHHFFLLFYNLEAAKEFIKSDMWINIGSSMDELGRHNPTLRPIILNEIKELVLKFPDFVNGKLDLIRFYTSPNGALYKSPLEAIIGTEEGAQEIECWEGIDGSNLYDGVTGFLGGLFQDATIWPKAVVEQIEFTAWEKFITIPNLPFDFTSSSGMLNLVGILKYLDEEKKSYASSSLYQTLLSLLEANEVKTLYSFAHSEDFLDKLEESPESTTQILRHMNSILNVLCLCTDYLGHSQITTETNVLLGLFLVQHQELVGALLDITETAMLAEIHIRSALPDDVIMQTRPLVESMTLSHSLAILPRKPPKKEPTETYTSAKYKNSLQIRFVMDQILQGSLAFLSCISRSCMLRRGEVSVLQWRCAFQMSTATLVRQLNRVLDPVPSLSLAKQDQRFLYIINLITNLCVYRDRGREVISTTFVGLFFHSSSVAEKIVSHTKSIFHSITRTPNDSFNGVKDGPHIFNSLTSIRAHALQMSFHLLQKLVTKGQVNKVPFHRLFYPGQFADQDSIIPASVITEAAVQASELLRTMIGVDSDVFDSRDYSVFSKLPAKISEHLVNIVREVWTVEPHPYHYNLDNTKLSQAITDLALMCQNSEDPTKHFRDFFAGCESWEGLKHDLQIVDPIELEMYRILKNKMSNYDFADFELSRTSTDAEKVIETFKTSNEYSLYSVSLIMIAELFSAQEVPTALAFHKTQVKSSVVQLVFDEIASLSESMVQSNVTKLGNLVTFLESLMSFDNKQLDEETKKVYHSAYETLLQSFLKTMKQHPQLVDTNYCSSCLSLLQQAVSRISSSVLEGMDLLFPDIHASHESKQDLANTILTLEPKSAVKSAIYLCRYMYLLAKEDCFRTEVMNSALLKSTVSHMPLILDGKDKLDQRNLHDSLILVFRACFESKSVLQDIISTEIVKQFRRSPTGKRDLRHFVEESRFLFARDPEVFLQTAAEMIRLENYDGKSSSHHKVYVLKSVLNGTEVKSEDVEMQTNEPLAPSGLMHLLLLQLMTVSREDWVSTPPSAEKNEDELTKKKINNQDFETLAENKKFAYMCFLLQTICELLGTYNNSKLEFITFSKHPSAEDKNKPRLTSLYFFIHQLIPSQQFVLQDGPEFQRREAISSLAKLTLLALALSTIIKNDKEPDPRNENADMAIVRKLMVDIISKILKETVNEVPTAKVYLKIFNIFDLCVCLLSSKFRELAYPLLSVTATKWDQFYIASAFFDAHLPNQITSVMSSLDLNFPEITKVLNVGLKVISSLGKIKLVNAEFFETAVEKEDDEIDEVEEKDDTPDLFRNSTLGMYDIEIDSEDEESFYQDQPMIPLSGSDVSEDESEDSDTSDLEMDTDDEDELVDEDSDDENEYDSEDPDNDIEIIEHLDLGSDSGSEIEVHATEEFTGFHSASGEDESMDDEEYDSQDEEGTFDEAELDHWLDEFADEDDEFRPSERVRTGDRFGGDRDQNNRSSLSLESLGESSSESETEGVMDSPAAHAREAAVSISSFIDALRPIAQSTATITPTTFLGGTIQIGAPSGNESSFPHFDAAFQALLNDERPKSNFDRMLIRSATERWATAYSYFFNRVDLSMLELVQNRLKAMISADSLEIFKAKAEQRERIRKERQEKSEKRREELRAKRAEEAQMREEEHASANESREPVMIQIGNREVDISGTDIDPEFFQALPEDMREEVFTQHVRERRAHASSNGNEVREIDPDFLDALPERIREDILQQESMARRFSRGSLGILLNDEEDDEDEFDEFSDEEEEEEGMDSQTATAGAPKPVDSKTLKRKTFSVPLVDRAGVASLVRLLFLPRPINQREHIYKTLNLICHNKLSRADVLNMLIAILHDGLASQKALEKVFAQVVAKAHAGKNAGASGPKSFPIGAGPVFIGVQVVDALLYLLEQNPSLRIFLLMEHENPFLTRKHIKKFRLKKLTVQEEKYPLNLLIRLLDNPLLGEEHFFIDLLANVLNFATKPLLVLLEKHRSAPSSFLTNFVPERNLRAIIKILASNECVNSTFRNAISAIHHLSLLKNAQAIFSSELEGKAGALGSQIITDLNSLLEELTKNSSKDAYESKIVGKFTATSSDQAKLLRILTALDYMYESIKKDGDDTENFTGLYKNLNLGNLWKALSDCLRILEQDPGVFHVATALLPLIEALMVVCKHSKIKDVQIKDLLKFEVKKIDFTKEPVENLFFTFTEEHKKILNQMVRSNQNLMSGPFSMLVRNSKVLEFDNKRNYFNRQLHDEKTAGSKMSISIRRDQVFLDLYRALFFKSTEEFKKAHLEINFKGEAGIDAGGVTREWYQVLSRQMFNPDYALFTAVASDENTYHPNRTSHINPEHLSFFKFIGRIIGKAIYDECFLDCHFSRALYKKILDRPVTLKDMENMDLEYSKSLTWMLENDITDIITEDFSVETDDYGEHKVIDLIPNGRNIPVTEENKQDYVRLVVEYRLQTSVKEQMSNFISGFHEIIPRDLVAIFDEQELELLISGLPDIDVQDWQNNTVYNNYSPLLEQIQWFWRAVKSFDNEERAKLLQFSTGTSKVPLNGFKELRGANGICKFSIHRDYGAKDRLPSSHTCFNQIDLPVYESYDTLRGSLLLAVLEGHEGFQLA